MSVANFESTLSIVDGGLAITDTSADGVTIKIGGCSGGVAGTFYSFAGSDTQAVSTTLGRGALVDSTIQHLLESGGKTVIAYKATTSTAGTSSAVTQTGGGPVVTLSGAPYDASETIMKIVVAGVLGTSQFIVTYDGGDTWSDPIATAASVALANNVTATMAAGSYVVDTTYAWTDTAPAMTTTNVGDALDACIVSPHDAEFVHVVGQTADAAAALTMATLLSTKVTASQAAHKYWRICMEAPAVDKATLISSFAAFDQRFVTVFGGFAEIVNARNDEIQKRSSGRVLMGRLARQPAAVNAARDTADSDLDPLTAIHKLVPDGAAAATGYHDEAATPGFTAARFMSLRSITGRGGYYPAADITMAATTSDYQHGPYARIILRAARAWYLFSLTGLGKRIRTNPANGYIRSTVADALELAGASAIAAALGDEIEQVRVRVNRADELTSDPTLRAKIRIVVSGYALEWEAELGLAASLPAAA